MVLYSAFQSMVLLAGFFFAVASNTAYNFEVFKQLRKTRGVLAEHFNALLKASLTVGALNVLFFLSRLYHGFLGERDSSDYVSVVLLVVSILLSVLLFFLGLKLLDSAQKCFEEFSWLQR